MSEHRDTQPDQHRTMQDAGTAPAEQDVAAGGMGPGLAGGSAGSLLGDLSGTLGALSGGLTAVPLETAAGLVGRLQTTLQGIGAPGVHEVAQSLGQLQQALVTRQLDGAGGLLARLAAQTMDVAEQNPGFVGDRLRTLSGMLTQGSERLG